MSGWTWMQAIATTFDTQPCPDCGVGLHVGEDVVTLRIDGWLRGVFHPDCARRAGW